MILAQIQPDDAGDRIHWSDRREIRFYEGGNSETLEYELYNEIIKTDDELMERSIGLGIRIEIKDDKVKVFASGDLLVGVVTSYSADVCTVLNTWIVVGVSGYCLYNAISRRVCRSRHHL